MLPLFAERILIQPAVLSYSPLGVVVPYSQFLMVLLSYFIYAYIYICMYFFSFILLLDKVLTVTV